MVLPTKMSNRVNVKLFNLVSECVLVIILTIIFSIVFAEDFGFRSFGCDGEGRQVGCYKKRR